MISRPNRFVSKVVSALGVLALLSSWQGGSLAQTPTQPAVATPAPRPVPLLQVRLSAAPSAASYNLGDPVAITWTLTNQSQGAVGLSGLVDGNLVVTSFTRDGVSLPVLPSAADYLDGFPVGLAASLRSVAAGSSLSSLWTSDFNQEVGGEALLAVTYTGADSGSGSYYSLAASGTYSLTFHYQYPGPTNTFPGTVFLGKTNSVTVTFTVL